ncbi:MAG: HNH endonuclease [Alphaproteobacteria bacterium]|nr:HNH endonuclease [Alphaproteobacteria bacterium]
MKKKKAFPKNSVCKPCWELQYCPYGSLVEFYMAPGGDWTLDSVTQQRAKIVSEFAEGQLKTEEDIWYGINSFLYASPEIWQDLQEYEPEDVSCRIFGHSCPVFWAQSGATETKEGRREGRFIPRHVMLKVVRRDNHVCQACHKYVPDDEVEFDHIIPISKGGPTSVSNLRLLCRVCNRKKSNGLDELIARPYAIPPKKISGGSNG